MAFIKINRQHFFHNLNQIALQTGSVDKIAIVLKDNAYGHGLEIMAELSSEFGIKHAIVRKTSEAKTIEKYFKNILILGDSIVNHEKFSYAINSLEDISCAQKGAKVELKIDTGMHRNGITIDELGKALEMIEKQGLKLIGVMTHFRSADALGSQWFWQKKNFESIKEKVKARGMKDIRFHAYNSASILRAKVFDEDLVRVGIGAYGYNELSEVFDKIELKPVLSLHAKKVSTRKLKTGQQIGYGGDFVTKKEMIVSTYALGYGDGWFRGVKYSPYITAQNQPIIGRVSMDFISLEGNKEEVCIMDNAQTAAKQLDTISYEIMTALDEKIERRVE
ncbi:MAG: alanine racemase [Sulfurovum sp.]|nr:alanine racemase [Sulfurovum sp.]